MPGDGDLPRGGRAGEPAPVHPEEQRGLPERDAAGAADALAVTLDFWDTLYEETNLVERLAHRRRAIAALLKAYDLDLPDDRVGRLYIESAHVADRWWREEHRGYTTAERLHWMIERAGGKPRANCEHVSLACEAVDAALLMYPPPLLPGAADAIRALAARFRLAIVSDTGFASGRAQDRLLEQDGLRGLFHATVYSMDIGHAKPRPEPFRAALAALAVPSPGRVIHVGDNERTDVRGALGAGLRAIRLDVVRPGGRSAAEFVAGSLAELAEYLGGRT